MTLYVVQLYTIDNCLYTAAPPIASSNLTKTFNIIECIIRETAVLLSCILRIKPDLGILNMEIIFIKATVEFSTSTLEMDN
jgi:hypothetical protein